MPPTKGGGIDGTAAAAMLVSWPAPSLDPIALAEYFWSSLLLVLREEAIVGDAGFSRLEKSTAEVARCIGLQKVWGSVLEVISG